MVQNMIRNDPRIANNPMMQQALEQMATNPAMAAQIGRMMQDPQMMQQMQAMMQNPEAMQAMRQMMPPGQQMPNFMPPTAGGTSTRTNNVGQQGVGDEELTEEEMIAEAIRRSLNDRNPPS
jgi:hypothetical protein